MDQQDRVAAFVEAHDLQADPAYRVLDLVSEVGEVAKEVTLSTGYGETGEVEIAADELGDVFFALLALADGVDVELDGALETAIAKYEARLDERDDAGSA